MRFGGHETFPVREGWLAKALRILDKSPEQLVDEYAEDYLGVGRNMAKSIRHWVVATGLAESTGSRRTKDLRLELTELGELIHEKDPHFLDPMTWWFLHINLVNSPQHAKSWHWFFNNWNHKRFERAVCVEGLRRFLLLDGKRQPSPRTLDRDLGCLLATYARRVPPDRTDPEDASECPFQELGLISHYKGSGYYVVHSERKHVDWPVFGYCVSRALEETGADEDRPRNVELPLTELERLPGGPGRCFQVGAEIMFDMLNQFEAGRGGDNLSIHGLAGERIVRVASLSPVQWARIGYELTEATTYA